MNDIDEGPSSDDLDRFGGETGYCPNCGEEIWDDVSICPNCRAAIVGASARPPGMIWWRQRWATIIILLIVTGLLASTISLFWALR